MTRTFAAWLLLLALFVAFHAGRAVAQDDCDPSGSAAVVQDLQLAESTEPVAEEQWQLPVGALSAEDLERAFQEVQRSGKGIMGFFGLLADGEKRQLDGATVRATVFAGLLDARETALAGLEAIQFSEVAVVADARGARTDRSRWALMAMLALGMLLVEWWYFHRRPGGARGWADRA